MTTIRRQWWRFVYGVRFVTSGGYFVRQDLLKMIQCGMEGEVFSLLAERFGAVPKRHAKFVSDFTVAVIDSPRHLHAPEVFLKGTISCLSEEMRISGEPLLRAADRGQFLWGKKPKSTVSFSIVKHLGKVTVIATPALVYFVPFLIALRSLGMRAGVVKISIAVWQRDPNCAYWGYRVVMEKDVKTNTMIPSFVLVAKNS